MGIEPTLLAWEAKVLPLNYTRKKHPKILIGCFTFKSLGKLVEGGGFEPPKAEPTDLQSVPVDRLGTPPKSFLNERGL